MNRQDSNGAIVVVSKCPIPGRSKTRLSTLVGDEGAALIAQSMLSDVLTAISDHPQLDEVKKILLYAPGDENGEKHMASVLHALDLNCNKVQDPFDENLGAKKNVEQKKMDETETRTLWHLLPMKSKDFSSSRNDMMSSDLGDKLTNALIRVRSLLKIWRYNDSDDKGNARDVVVFLGMDCPILPFPEIVTALRVDDTCFLCPADDGGYGMISIPSVVKDTPFEGVRWSNKLTALSQLKALSDIGCKICIGRMMQDIDDPEDLFNLATFLVEKYCENNSSKLYSFDLRDDSKPDALTRWSDAAEKTQPSIKTSSGGQCRHTWEALLHLGLVHIEEDRSHRRAHCMFKMD